MTSLTRACRGPAGRPHRPARTGRSRQLRKEIVYDHDRHRGHVRLPRRSHRPARVLAAVTIIQTLFSSGRSKASSSGWLLATTIHVPVWMG
jgi:hypothetical protein